jgi:hypothetical protein
MLKMHNPPQPIDAETVERLTRGFARVIKQHYLAGPSSRDRVYEILNALAAMTSLVVIGAGAEANQAREWFLLALRQHLAEIAPGDRDAEILNALREAMQYRISSSLQDGEVSLVFGDAARAEQLYRNLNRLVFDDVAVTVMFEGVAGLRKTGAADV